MLEEVDVSAQHRPRRSAFPLTRWPERDGRAWDRAKANGDFLDDDGAAAVWSAATHRSVVGTYGRWLAYLEDHGLLDPTAGPAERITEDTLKGYVSSLCSNGCASVTIASYIAVLSMAIQAMAPDHDWGWLRAVQARLQRLGTSTRDKRSRLVPVADLIALGMDLMRDEEAPTYLGASRLSAALSYRDGLMISLMAMRPLRQLNFISMEIGRHLVVTSDGYALRFAREETKGRRHLEFSFPGALVPALQRYLDHYRPRLLALREHRGFSRQSTLPRAGNRLWVTQYGTPFSASAHWSALQKHTTARFGHFVNPHAFRDVVASDVATHDPEHVRIAAQILGHSDFRTTEKHYIHAQAHIARRRYHDLILSMRAPEPKSTSRSRAGASDDVG